MPPNRFQEVIALLEAGRDSDQKLEGRPIVLDLGGWRQEDQDFKARLRYIVSARLVWAT